MADKVSVKVNKISVPQYEMSAADSLIPEKDFGEDMFDPTGFVPLKVMIEQQRAAGANALLQRSMFDFEDWEDIYLDTEKPDFTDDFQVMEYIQEIERKKSELLQQRQKELGEEFAAFMASKRSNNDNATTTNDDAMTKKSSSKKAVENPPENSEA